MRHGSGAPLRRKGAMHGRSIPPHAPGDLAQHSPPYAIEARGPHGVDHAAELGVCREQFLEGP